MPSTPEFYTLAEFRKLSGSFKKPVVIYFSANQLGKLTSGARPMTGKPPAKSLHLTVTEVAGFDGAFVTPNCPETPTKIGSGELRCGSAPGIPSAPGSGGIQLDACFLSFRADGTVTCKGTCARGNCTLGRWRAAPGSNIVIYTCSCR